MSLASLGISTPNNRSCVPQLMYVGFDCQVVKKYILYWKSLTLLSMVKQGEDQGCILDLGFLVIDTLVSSILSLYLV